MIYVRLVFIVNAIRSPKYGSVLEASRSKNMAGWGQKTERLKGRNTKSWTSQTKPFKKFSRLELSLISAFWKFDDSAFQDQLLSLSHQLNRKRAKHIFFCLFLCFVDFFFYFFSQFFLVTSCTLTLKIDSHQLIIKLFRRIKSSFGEIELKTYFENLLV